MKTKYKVIIATLLVILAAAGAGLYISFNNVPMLQPKGFIAEKQRDLLYIASILMLIVVIPVLFMALFFGWKYREENDKSKYSPDWSSSHVAEAVWWGIPFAIIIVLAVITWKSSHDLSPFKPLQSDKKPIHIQVVALQWKWLFIYPEEGVASVNFFQFPEKVPLSFEITSDAPMNSFWIPQLGGQIYAMPAMRSKLHLIANEPGEYRGSSSNISGEGFAGMFFTAKASSHEEYEKWLQSAKQSKERLNFNEYEELVKPSSYNPVALYNLPNANLFDKILEKYEAPKP